jgi:hypothetical protein
MMNRWVCFLALFLLGLTGCEKDFIIDEQQQDNKLTVNCIFNNYSVFKVYVTRSNSLSGSSKLVSVSDAVVTLYEDDTEKEKLVYVPSDSANTFGSYQSALIPVAGKKYTIKVEHSTYGTVTASDVMPALTTINNLQLITYNDTANSDLSTLQMNFADDGSSANYYRLSPLIIVTTKLLPGGTTDSVDHDYVYATRPIALSDLIGEVRDNSWDLLFTDRNFNGQNKVLKFNTTSASLLPNDKAVYYVQLHTVSYNNYQYYKTLELYRNSNNGQSEPVHVYGNVQGGYGIFAADNLFQVPVTIQ